jgi:diaminohydroxyphosphoribosylaminopyrimidine deaminase/5-amino-6-(5-phosphoribosylamino)uracil reductase
MARALAIGERGRGWSSPNPAVGAVLVANDEIVGEGHTQPPGQAHAEVMALRDAGERARGATLYVTLEPCCHVGRTGPCTEALLAAGVAEVHVGVRDPSPWVDGGGVAVLQQAGIPVTVGEREEECRRAHEAYFKWVRTRRPFVTLKYGMTLDGKIATRSGSARWVTGPAARGRVAVLRAQADAVVVGIGTALADDPLLTARPSEFGVEWEGPVHQPLRVILDSKGRLPPASVIATTAGEFPTLVLTTERAPADATAKLEAMGIEVVRLSEREGRVSLPEALDLLGQRPVTSVLLESGGTLAASFLEVGAVDRILAFISPKIVGGSGAPGPIAGSGVDLMEEAIALDGVAVEQIGEDLLVSGYPRPGCGA